MTHKDLMANLFSGLRFQQVMNLLLIIAVITSSFVSLKLYEGITVNIPPDLRQGAILKNGEILPESVFVFTTTMFQSLNNWRKDGDEDYEDNLNDLRPFFTEEFIVEIKKDLIKRRRNSELKGVTRRLALPPKFLFNADLVDVIDSNTWVVKLPLQVKEWVDDKLTKDIENLYSFVVKRERSNIGKNAHQIAIHRFYQRSVRTKDFLSDNPIKQDLEVLVDAL